MRRDESVRTRADWLLRGGLALMLGVVVVSAEAFGEPRLATGPARVTIDVKDAEIGRVLDIIARASGLNIVVGREVRGRVTVHMREVAWPLALKSILLANGYGFVRDENVIRVDKLETLRAERAARLPRRDC